MPEPAPLRLHDEDPALFREAVRFTAAQTGFVPRLIEKDYFCTVVLEYLSPSAAELVFRGGTCLAKIHAEFYRLSEDLDFVIPTPLDASRSDRSRLAARSKRAVGMIGRQVPGLRVITALTGANDSSQYAAVLGYTSVLSTRGQDWVSRARAMRRMVSEKRTATRRYDEIGGFGPEGSTPLGSTCAHVTGTPIARRMAFSISTMRAGARLPPSARGTRRSRRSVVICSHFAIDGRGKPPS